MAAKKDAYSEPLQYPNIKIFFDQKTEFKLATFRLGRICSPLPKRRKDTPRPVAFLPHLRILFIFQQK